MSSALTPKEELLKKLHALGVEPKRGLGQNFLISGHVISRIFDDVDRLKPTFVVEVGPGLGALTESLIRRKGRRLLIEMDNKYAKYWRDQGEEVIEDDALQVDWVKMPLPEPTLLLSNLPYQISSRLVIDRSPGPRQITDMILMFQKEVAERLVAGPSTADYGFLSVVAQSFWSMRVVVDASPECFYPIPNVSSRVMGFSRRKDVVLSESYIKFVKEAFQFRRKLLIKNLKPREAKLRPALQELGFSDKTRAEELSAQDFQRLFAKM